MKIIRTLPFWPQAAHGSVMALGNFDGMHKGHQAVIGRAREIARHQGRPLAVMTFEPHPRRYFNPQLPVLRIVPFAEKARLLRDAGVDYLYVVRFNKQFSELSADAFAQQILQDGLRVAHVVTGHNFAYGHRRSGDVSSLRAASARFGFDYTQVEPAMVAGGDVYSSTAIRHALDAGDVEAAAKVLGRAYAIQGVIIHGEQRGAGIGFPTANMRPAPLYLPRYGVYAVRMRLAGAVYDAVANLGVRPTVDGAHCLLETHALNAQFDAYGEPAEITFLRFIRPERKFDGLEALKAQIAQDVQAAHDIHAAQQEQAL
jgi:riboflavin kinase / FMN adenylyltransferase